MSTGTDRTQDGTTLTADGPGSVAQTSSRADDRRGGDESRSSAKVLVPPLASGVVPRTRLDERLEEVDRRRLALLVAAPGLGKTTLLAGWATSRNSAWYTVGVEDRDPGVMARGLLAAARLRIPTVDPVVAGPPRVDDELGSAPEAHASFLADVVCGVFAERLVSDLVLVLDDLHELGTEGPSVRFVTELVRGAPSRLHVVIASRVAPPFGAARLRAQGLLLDLPGSALRFTRAETRAVARQLLGRGGDAVAEQLHALTAGWPAAARLMAESLRDAPSPQWAMRLAQGGEPGGPVAALLAEEVLPATPGPVIELLSAVVGLERFPSQLAAELSGVSEQLVGDVAREGLWLVADGDPPGWYSVPPLVGRFLRRHLGLGDADRDAARRQAQAWMEGHGHSDPALARLLTDRDEAPLTPGDGSASRVGEHPSGDAATADIPSSVVFHEAGGRLLSGDWDGVLELVAPYIAGGGPVAMPAALLAGLVHHLRGEIDEALALYERGLVRADNEALRAMLLGWASAACWLVGDLSRCRELASQAETAADRSGDDRAAAVAHTALAMVAALDGDRRANDLHYLRALEHAEAAHDHVQIVRIRTNRGSRFLEEGYYREALAELDEAVRLADLAAIAPFRPLALSNRGQALMALGRLDEAARELRAARLDYERLGSRMTSYPLARLGDVYRHQGQLTLARGHYEEAIAVAEASGDLQGLVPALAGLALILCDGDADEAVVLAERAVAAGPCLARPDALIAAAEVTWRRGDRSAAATWAQQAITAARGQRDRPALAAALELQARLAEEHATALRLLDEAAALWGDIGNPVGQARVLLAQARLAAPQLAVALAAEAEQRLRSLGARALAADAARLHAEVARAARPALAVRVLGGFTVERGGVAVAAGEWQSRKARDLLKILIVRRGHPVPRDVLMDLLWPDEDPARASARLSVALSTLRSVLDPDKRFDPEHFVANDRAAAWLRLEHVAVDVESFLAGAAAGLKALGAGDSAASERLAAAEASYAGELLEEDPYSDWTIGLREEARATYMQVAMALADIAVASGDHDAAVRYLLRVLARDPYDERAHLRLVATLSAAGRHGDARRAFRSYCQRMADIAVEPSPFPDTTRRKTGSPRAAPRNAT